MFQNLRKRIEKIRWEDAVDPSRWVKFAHGQVRLYSYIVRELIRDRCLQQAAALTFTTLLSLVPLFAVAFSFFRGFAALEVLEQKAQQAIFEGMLAGAFVEERAPALAEGPGAPGAAGLSAEELLARADSMPRARAAGDAVGAYLDALSAGADAGAVRAGVSRLHLGRVGDLQGIFGGMEADSRRRYFVAAGLDPNVIGRPDTRGDAESRHYRNALELRAGGEYARAVAALRKAEGDGHPPRQTRLASADAREAQADGLAARGGLASATEHYGNALADYCDVLVLAGSSGSGGPWSRALEGHKRTVGKLDGVLGEALAALGRTGEDRGVEKVEGTPEEYMAAFQEGREVAARGVSTIAVDYIRMFIDKVGRAEIGVIGILFLLVTATSLLSTIEKTLNHIWKVSERRPFWIKFTSFCTLIWLGPALIGGSIWAREQFGDFVADTFGRMAVIGPLVGVLTVVGEHLLPFMTVWLLLVALYKFLPHTRVRFSSVAWGALLAAVLFQLAKPLFGIYIFKAIRYERIYGSLGAVPLFLIWIWLLWVIVLFGAEVAFTIQNVGLLRYHDKLHRLSNLFIDRYLAARIMMYVAREFWETGQPVTSARLAEILQMPPEGAADAAGRLVRLGLLTPVGEERDEFHPARDLSKLELSEVLSITDRFRDESRSPLPEDRPYEDKLERVFRAAIQSQEDVLNQMTFRDLLRECEEDKGRSRGGRDSEGG